MALKDITNVQKTMSQKYVHLSYTLLKTKINSVISYIRLAPILLTTYTMIAYVLLITRIYKSFSNDYVLRLLIPLMKILSIFRCPNMDLKHSAHISTESYCLIPTSSHSVLKNLSVKVGNSEVLISHLHEIVPQPQTISRDILTRICVFPYFSVIMRYARNHSIPYQLLFPYIERLEILFTKIPDTFLNHLLSLSLQAITNTSLLAKISIIYSPDVIIFLSRLELAVSRYIQSMKDYLNKLASQNAVTSQDTAS